MPKPLEDVPSATSDEIARIFSIGTVRKLAAYLAPHIEPDKRKLVYIFPISNRLAHMAMEPHALVNLYGRDFDEIIVLIENTTRIPVEPGPYAVSSAYVRFVEVDDPDVIKLGHFNAPPQDLGPMKVVFMDPVSLMQAFYNHRVAGGDVLYFDMPAHVSAVGDEFLCHLGVREGEPIVTLHAREMTYLASARYNQFRCVDIANYRLAIEALAENGYWVFRLGDPSSARLEIDHRRVVDLPHHPRYDPLLDPALIARSRFSIMSSSGPEALSRSYGTPMLLANCHVQHTIACNDDDVLLFKRYRLADSDRYLSYAEILDRGLALGDTTAFFEDHGIVLEENTAEDLREAVLEMQARTEGVFAGDEEIDRRFRTIGGAYATDFAARPLVGRDHRLPDMIFYGFGSPTVNMCQSFCRTHPSWLDA
jgi:putative glycosyltransferase (TIGR04372 family)